jgi:hypothetical protein
MPPEERGEYVQDYIVISAEVEADLAFDPIEQRKAQLMDRFRELDVLSRWGRIPLHDPPRADNTVLGADDFDIEVLKNWWASGRRWGAQCWVQTRRGRVTGSPVWIRNADAPGVSPASLAHSIAELLAWKAAVERLERDGTAA